MIRLGITGGIGSGKSTVCRMLEDLGARVFYADEEARRLMNEDPETRADLIAAFGEESYTRDGKLDRAYLAEQVFGNPRNVARINGIVHPRVRRALLETAARAEAEGVPLMVYEAALIFETGGDRVLDAVAVVDAPEAERIHRVTERDGVTDGQVRARMGHQLPPEELRRRADYIIENHGSLGDLRLQVEALYRDILRA